MKQCIECGADLPDTAAYCGKCGRKQNNDIEAAKSAEELYLLGKQYEEGDGVRQNLHKAIQCYKKAAEQGNAKAQYEIGECLDDGYGVDRDWMEALVWFRKSAMQGYADAQYRMGGHYYGNNTAKALEWYKKAAKQGNVDAKEMIATIKQRYGLS